MTHFELNDKTYSMPSSWAEVTLEQYIQISDMNAHKEFFEIEELGTIRMLEILAGAQQGEMDEMTIGQMAQLENELAWVHTSPAGKITDHVVIEGQEYGVKVDMNGITLGEMASIKTFQDEAKSQDLKKFLPQMMAILIRPAKKVIKAGPGEGTTKWVLDRFVAEDIQERAELFKKHLSVELVTGVLNFFFSTSKG